MYDVVGYFNTGFNAVNVPASPGILESVGTRREFQAVDILQDDGLSSVSVRASWDEIADVDYMKIGSIYYAVTGSPVMTSADVAAVPLLADYLTTAGGAGSLTYTDGIVKRMTVSNDSWGAYPEHDEYMAPADPLQMDVGAYVGDDAGGACYIFIESTIDLVSLSEQFDTAGNFTGVGITFTDEASDTSVTVPYTGGDPGTTSFSFGPYAWESPATKLYDGTNEKINRGLDALRCIGATSAIISQVAIPKSRVTAKIDSDGGVTDVTAVVSMESSGLATAYSGSSLSKIDYSDFCSYGMVTAGGSKMEATPLQVSATGNTPEITILTDPRPTGKSYFKYSDLPGSTYHSYFLNAVDGAEWASVPLVWREPEGSYQTKTNFSLAARSAESANNFAKSNAYIGLAQTAVQTVGNIGAALAADNAGAIVTQGISAIAGGALQMVQQARSESQRQAQYNMARERELQAYAVSQTVVTPDVQCPFNASLLRDFFGNGAFCYRLRYSSADVARIHNILRRFGYKTTCILQARAFADAGDGYAYVQADGANVADNIPRRWKSGIADQLSGGVRVWYQHPEGT